MHCDTCIEESQWKLEMQYYSYMYLQPLSFIISFKHFGGYKTLQSLTVCPCLMRRQPFSMPTTPCDVHERLCSSLK